MKILFYYPRQTLSELNPNRGSELRPIKMYEAFQKLGYEVDLVDGTNPRRRKLVKEVVRKIKQGVKYDFMYVENSNKPNCLNGKFPYIHDVFLELSFFDFLKKNNCKIGLFYRDVFWRFSFYKDLLPWYKRFIVLPFYYYDLWVYKKTIDIIFLPVKELNDKLPFNVSNNAYDLPPGTETKKVTRIRKKSKNLKLLYVGGVEPPNYDLTLILRTVNNIKNIEFTICTREGEWREWKNYYNIPANVKVLHRSANELANVYLEHDLFISYKPEQEYLYYCMPIKIFESISNEIPIIVNDKTKLADMVNQLDIGWVINCENDLNELLNNIMKDKSVLLEKRNSIMLAKEKNTWYERAKFVTKLLSEKS